MKAILVIDMPNETEAEDYCLRHGLFVNKGEKPFRLGEIAFECNDIDLRPLPSQMEYNDNLWTSKAEEEYYKEGWNRFYETITGETE